MAILQKKAQYMPETLEIRQPQKIKRAKNAQGAVNDTKEGENDEILKKNVSCVFSGFEARIIYPVSVDP